MKNLSAGLRTGGLLICVLISMQAVSGQQTKPQPRQASSQFTSRDVARLTLAGRKLSAEEAVVLEDKLTRDPWDLEARFTLSGYYSTSFVPSFRKQQRRHGLWFIQNLPDSPLLHSVHVMHLNQRDEGYEEAKQLWLKHLEAYKDNLVVLSNAIDFFLLSDRPLAEKLLQRGATADPSNSQWPRELGHLYMLELGSVSFQQSHHRNDLPVARTADGRLVGRLAPEDRRDASIRSVSPPPDQVGREYAKVVAVPTARQLEQERLRLAALASGQFELAYKLTRDDMEKRSLLVDLAKSAFEAGEVERARSWAVAMLTPEPTAQKDWNYGNVVHHGHLILGRIAILSGDLAEAKQQLIAAGQTPGSPQLDSFGPNMTLAKELLEKGERDSVIKYFELCASFWKNHKLDSWTATVKGGGIPDFGANLAY